MENSVSILQWIKSQFSRERFLQSSVRVNELTGPHRAKSQPYSYEAAVRLFRSWVYAAAKLNAQAAASATLRLYVRKKRVAPLWNTRAVPRARKRWIIERASPTVRRKVVEFNDDFEEVTEEHPVLRLLRTSNPWMNGYDLAELRFLYLELTGNAYLHPIAHPVFGWPTELWPMPSQWVDVIPGEPDTGEFIKGYAYGMRYDQKRFFSPDEVGHWRYPNPGNLYYGLGKVEAGWGVVQQNEAVHEFDLATFKNHARPDYAVIVKSGASSDALDRFQTEIDGQLRGASRARRFVTIGGDVQIVPLSFPPKDLGGREEIVEEIAAVFGVPVSLLKANDPNLASAKVGLASWKSGTIEPMLRLDEEKLNEWLLPMYGIEGDAFLAYDSPVPEDVELEDRIMASKVSSGRMTINEARQADGLEPVEGGDEPRVNGMALSAIDRPAAAPGGLFGLSVPPPATPSAPAPVVNVAAPAVDTATLVRSVVEAIQKAAPVPAPAPVVHTEAPAVIEIKQSDLMYDGSHPCGCQCKQTSTGADDNARDESERRVMRFASALAAVLADMRDGLLSVIGTKAAEPTPPSRVSLAEIIERANSYGPKLREVLDEGIRDALQAGGETGLRAVREAAGGASGGGDEPPGGTDPFDVTNPEVERFLGSRDFAGKLSDKVAGEITQFVIDRLSPTLAEGIAAGETPRELGNRIQALDDQLFSGYRSEMIARTESARAYVRGEMAGWVQSGIVRGKRWKLAAGSCSFCRAAAAAFNAKLLAIDEVPDGLRRGAVLETADGVMRLDYEDIIGPPIHPHDRCDIEPVIED